MPGSRRKLRHPPCSPEIHISVCASRRTGHHTLTQHTLNEDLLCVTPEVFLSSDGGSPTPRGHWEILGRPVWLSALGELLPPSRRGPGCCSTPRSSGQAPHGERRQCHGGQTLCRGDHPPLGAGITRSESHTVSTCLTLSEAVRWFARGRSYGSSEGLAHECSQQLHV